MKRKLFTSLFAGLLLMGMGLMWTSCSNDDTINLLMDYEPFTVNASEWTWNSTKLRWEAKKQFQSIDNYIYEKGTVVGYIFFGAQNVDETQAQLPYISKAYILDNGDKFTETIGFEFSDLNKTITFYISPSDGVQDEEARSTYNFRVTTIW